MYNAACNATAPKRTGGNGGTPGGIQILCIQSFNYAINIIHVDMFEAGRWRRGSNAAAANSRGPRCMPWVASGGLFGYL
jgi:hypothetical protein